MITKSRSDCCSKMRLRSGREYNAVSAPRNATVVVRRKKKRKGLPRTLGGLKKSLEGLYGEKKRFEFGRSTAAATSTFNSYLIGSEVTNGGQSWERTGEQITLTRVYVKFSCRWTVIQPATIPYGGVAYVYAYIVQCTRMDNPSTHWYQALNSDNNVAFGSAPQTNTGDNTRVLSKLNKREIRVLAKKRIMISPRSDSDPKMCNYASFSISTKKLKKKMHYNTIVAQPTPYGPAECRPNIYVVWYALQPDESGVRGEIGINLTGTMYWNET